jgi:heme/copper-type cytochrome/quinol oxidase subunit 3
MIRPILTEIALFLIPFALYALFLVATRSGVLDASAWTISRISWLAIAALVLMISSLLWLAEFGGSPPGSTYVPAHIEDGKFVPGQTR